MRFSKWEPDIRPIGQPTSGPFYLEEDVLIHHDDSQQLLRLFVGKNQTDLSLRCLAA
jgi:hypothetical protein